MGKHAPALLRTGAIASVILACLGMLAGGVGAAALDVYTDEGTFPGAQVFTWPTPPTGDSWNGAFSGGCPADSATCFETVSTSWAGWGVFVESRDVDLTPYNKLSLAIKSPCDLKIEIADKDERKKAVFASSYGFQTDGGTAWQSVEIPTGDLTGAGMDMQHVYGIFLVTATQSCTYYIDAVRWDSATPSMERTWGTLRAIWE